MPPGPKTFVGFRGLAAQFEIGKVRFWVLAKNARELEALCLSAFNQPFDPSKCKPAILIEASVLPDRKNLPSAICHLPSQPDALDRLNAELLSEENSEPKKPSNETDQDPQT